MTASPLPVLALDPAAAERATHPGLDHFGTIERSRPNDPGTIGGVVSHVRAGGPSQRAGLQVSDRVVAIDGVVPRDLTDVRYQTQVSDEVTLDVLRDGTLLTLEVDLSDVEDLGLDFEQPTFDGLRQCNNNCEFCFIRGLPKGLRRSLYVRDDDYRYSFLFGSFVTLTNLAEEDWHRIAFQRLSPLRVSVHATDPELRARLLAHPGAAPILPQLSWLGRAGVQVHGQIVLCPGLNDGPVLDQTLRDLSALPDVVQSVAVVPVGVSAHLRTRDVRPLTGEDAARTLKLVLRWHRELRRTVGRGFVYPSDEMFLMAGRRLPGPAFYDDFPQLQNGVGLVRVMLADWRRTRHRLPERVEPARRVAWLCGRAAAPALRQMAEECRRIEGLEVEVRVVENTLFGSAITVSGLMSGQDIARTLRAGAVDLAILPRSAFGFEGARTLDEWTPDSLEEATGVPIRVGRTAADLVELSTR
ncbi:MAG: DUF512 domain-containing protein [Chloroflexi bacterium]|nr:DUF512 domain-containing protein [Chloroflexota bacterium]